VARQRSPFPEGAWIKPHHPDQFEPWPQSGTILAAHDLQRASSIYASIQLASANFRPGEEPVSRSDFARLERRLTQLQAALESHREAAKQRTDFLLGVLGLPEVTPGEIDKLAEEALRMLRAEGVADPITFAERKRIDLRLADLAYRRLIQQDLIEEA
jgi:hypothetical protein